MSFHTCVWSFQSVFYCSSTTLAPCLQYNFNFICYMYLLFSFSFFVVVIFHWCIFLDVTEQIICGNPSGNKMHPVGRRDRISESKLNIFGVLYLFVILTVPFNWRITFHLNLIFNDIRLRRTHLYEDFRIVLVYHKQDTSMLASFHSFAGTVMHQSIVSGNMWKHDKELSFSSCQEDTQETLEEKLLLFHNLHLHSIFPELKM